MAEYMYRTASAYTAAQSITVTNTSQPFFAYFAPSAQAGAGSSYGADSAAYAAIVAALEGWGDAFLRRVAFHTPTSDGRLAEEFNRDTGVPQGAGDLTWSYAALLTAAFARAELVGDEGYIGTLAKIGV